ncbi:hypothetical protein PSECIP111951_01723 [Pseudoalteromonas holothuriae]|uniref:Uncharacterized protein n=1 Tax=Pseudoalteromonas holothuriae TaxID=2963714 RepID=A0ABN8UKC5_9GAMM|nr:hypothetical protein PSECIP111951_01723 [Pseudoalteromonas sp. CIP111951]
MMPRLKRAWFLANLQAYKNSIKLKTVIFLELEKWDR